MTHLPFPRSRWFSAGVCLLAGLVLCACGGGAASGGSEAEAIDLCSNYQGNQVPEELAAKGFVEDGLGGCLLARNHEALALSGIDKALMDGWTGANNLIAVIDSGYRVTHEAIVQKTQTVAAYHDDSPANYLLDYGEKEDGVAGELVAAHGTAVAALVAGEGVGVAPGAGLWLKATEDENPLTRDLAIATVDALNNEGIDIINHSNDLFDTGLIYRTAANDETGILPALRASRAVVVASAGNSGQDLSDALDTAQAQVSLLQSFLELSDEAGHVLLVGVYDEAYGDLALFSNYPGHRVEVQERFIVVGGETLESASSGSDTGYRNVSGTSFAAPIVSGAVAVLKEANPNLTAADAAGILLETARRPSELGYGTNCGSQTALGGFSGDCGAMKFGMGIVDLPTAIARAEQLGAAGL